MTKEDVRAKIQSVGLIPAVRVSTPEDAWLAAEAVSRGGIPIVELTMTVPKAAELITHLLEKHPHMVVGAGTEVISAEGQIVTAGGIDSHIHFICPQLVTTALSAGVTTLLGGGSGPATGTNATTCTPGPWNMHRMLESAEGFPINLGFLG